MWVEDLLTFQLFIPDCWQGWQGGCPPTSTCALTHLRPVERISRGDSHCHDCSYLSSAREQCVVHTPLVLVVGGCQPLSGMGRKSSKPKGEEEACRGESDVGVTEDEESEQVAASEDESEREEGSDDGDFGGQGMRERGGGGGGGGGGSGKNKAAPDDILDRFDTEKGAADGVGRPRVGSEQQVPCKHCVRTFDRLHKQTIRLHERDCPQNPHRRTWRCEECDKNFPYKYSLYKHEQSVAHQAASDVFATPPQRPPPGPLKRKAPEAATPATQRPRREHGERHHRAFEAGPYTTTISPLFQLNYDFSRLELW